jgi:hypothetical protein
VVARQALALRSGDGTCSRFGMGPPRALAGKRSRRTGRTLPYGTEEASPPTFSAAARRLAYTRSTKVTARARLEISSGRVVHLAGSSRQDGNPDADGSDAVQLTSAVRVTRDGGFRDALQGVKAVHATDSPGVPHMFLLVMQEQRLQLGRWPIQSGLRRDPWKR